MFDFCTKAVFRALVLQLIDLVQAVGVEHRVGLAVNVRGDQGQGSAICAQDEICGLMAELIPADLIFLGNVHRQFAGGITGIAAAVFLAKAAIATPKGQVPHVNLRFKNETDVAAMALALMLMFIFQELLSKITF